MRPYITKILKEAAVGKRGGKWVETQSGRKVYIKDNGSAYLHNKTDEEKIINKYDSNIFNDSNRS